MEKPPPQEEPLPPGMEGKKSNAADEEVEENGTEEEKDKEKEPEKEKDKDDEGEEGS